MFEPEDWLTIGKLIAPQGLNGELRINGTIVALIRHTANTSVNVHYSGEASVIAYLKRGDYVEVHGERHMPDGYGHFEIFKI